LLPWSNLLPIMRRIGPPQATVEGVRIALWSKPLSIEKSRKLDPHCWRRSCPNTRDLKVPGHAASGLFLFDRINEGRRGQVLGRLQKFAAKGFVSAPALDLFEQARGAHAFLGKGLLAAFGSASVYSQ
jgi:hypothetical protein